MVKLSGCIHLAIKLFLFDVPVRYDFWVYNFIFYWTFLIEIGVVIWAVVLFLRNRKEFVETGLLKEQNQLLLFVIYLFDIIVDVF